MDVSCNIEIGYGLYNLWIVCCEHGKDDFYEYVEGKFKSDCVQACRELNVGVTKAKERVRMIWETSV